MAAGQIRPKGRRVLARLRERLVKEIGPEAVHRIEQIGAAAVTLLT